MAVSERTPLPPFGNLKVKRSVRGGECGADGENGDSHQVREPPHCAGDDELQPGGALLQGAHRDHKDQEGAREEDGQHSSEPDAAVKQEGGAGQRHARVEVRTAAT